MIDTTTVSITRMLDDRLITIGGWLGPMNMAVLLSIKVRSRLPVAIVRPRHVSRSYMAALVVAIEQAASRIAAAQREEVTP